MPELRFLLRHALRYAGRVNRRLRCCHRRCWLSWPRRRL